MRAVGDGELAGFRQEFVTAARPLTATEEKNEWWSTQGRLTTEYLSDGLSGAGAGLRQEPNHTSTARLDLGGRVGGWKYSTLLYFTSDENGHDQPRNRMAFHLDHRWVGVDVGDVNYDFSDFTLQAKRTRGIGGFVRLGPVELRLLHGAIDRAIPGTVVDSAGLVRGVTGATFRRNLLGARLAVGQGRTAQLGLDLLRVRDDVTSIPVGLLPKDNLVLGSNLTFAPFHRRVILDGEAAVSFLSNDISGGALSRQTVDSLANVHLPAWFNPDKYSNLFIVNLSTTPLDPRGLPNLAWKTSVTGTVRGNSLEARYQSIGPSFQSLAAPSIQSDRRGLRLADSYPLLQHRLALSGEYEQFSDNLKGGMAYTTDTRILGASADLMPDWAGFKHVTMEYHLYSRSNDAPPESLLTHVDETTHVFRAGAGYHFRFHQDHAFSLQYQLARTGSFQDAGNARASIGSLVYETSWARLPLTANLRLEVNRTDYPFAQAPNPLVVKYTTWGLGGTYRPWAERLEIQASWLRVHGSSDQDLLNGLKTTWNVDARYRLDTNNSVSGRASLVRYSGKPDPAGAFDPSYYRENIIDLRVLHEF